MGDGGDGEVFADVAGAGGGEAGAEGGVEDEMLEGGLTQDDCIEIARQHARSGLIDFISIVGGTAVDYKATAQIWPTMWLPTGRPKELLVVTTRSKALTEAEAPFEVIVIFCSFTTT